MPDDVPYDEIELRRVFEPICTTKIHEIVPVFNLNGDLNRLKDISELDIKILERTS